MTMVVGLVGKAGAGKDTVANYLWERYAFCKVPFALALKQAAVHVFGLPMNYFEDRNLKEEVLPYWGMSPREMLQKLGTEATKPVFGETIWLKRWCISYEQLKGTDHVVVPDVRFGPEADYLRSIGGLIVHIDRDVDGLPNGRSAHVSEAGLPRLPEDHILPNNGSLAELAHHIEVMVTTRFKGCP